MLRSGGRIPAPKEVDEIMKRVPDGKVITINQIRETLARKHGTTICCPLSTGMFVWVAAHAAEEALSEDLIILLLTGEH